MKSKSRTADIQNNRLKITGLTPDVQKKNNELLLCQRKLAIFTSAADNSDPIVNEYMCLMRRLALDRMKASWNSSETPEPSPSLSSLIPSKATLFIAESVSRSSITFRSLPSDPRGHEKGASLVSYLFLSITILVYIQRLIYMYSDAECKKLFVGHSAVIDPGTT